MPPLLFYTSRSPIIEGQTHCNYARYLGYHAGPHGTGWRRRATHVPLATGSAVHAGLEALGQWLMGHDEEPESVIPADAAASAAETYEVEARAKGLLLQAGEPLASLDTLILEQRTLIEGLIWVWALERLPGLLRDYRVIDVEHEEMIILDCTCGLGESVYEDTLHAARRCKGIVQQGRADWLLESRLSGEITYLEFKTKATPNLGWERAWEHSGQLLVNMEAASRRLSKPVSQAIIDVLYKGRRASPNKDGGQLMQQSSLCYGIYEPGGLGAGSSWRQRKDREYWSHTVPIWDETYPMDSIRPGASRVESWVSGRSWPGVVQALGPFPRPMALVEKALKSIEASERLWKYAIEDIRNGTDPEDLIDRSWQCTGFDGTPCQFVPICFDQPEAESLYEPRTPHHAPERAAFEAAGIVFAEDGVYK